MEKKYKVSEWRKLKSWEPYARAEIFMWLTDESYQKEICDTTMTKEMMGPFTKFLYHFACSCECGWGVLIDFNERSQKVFLPDRYYKWMHQLRDECMVALEQLEEYSEPKPQLSQNIIP